MTFEHYRPGDYEAVCDFLIGLNREDRRHVNWNWARWEWMIGHPEFDTGLISSIGLWKENGAVVGAAIYDMYFGEAFCGVLRGYEALYPEVLAYAYENLKDESGLAAAVCDDNAFEREAIVEAGFSPIEQDETIMVLDLDRAFEASLPEGFRIEDTDPAADPYGLQWLFWQGFDHGDDREAFEREGLADLTQLFPRPHLNPELSLTAVAPGGEKAAFCGLWFHDGTDYAYVEPVCTVPAYRGRGLAKALLFEAFRRAAALGAKKAYVISDQVFYEKLGFRREKHFTFYRRA